MEAITKWLATAFKNPLSVLFFFLGTLLILLGISTGLSLPILNQVVPDVGFRWASLVIGIVCCVMAVVMYYRPPKLSKYVSASGQKGIPEEFALDFSGRRATLSENQDVVLSYIANNTTDNNYISQDKLEHRFSQYTRSELLYRLEQLRLLGFLERQRLGKNGEGADRFSYRISHEYQESLGDAVQIRSLRVGQSSQPQQNRKG